MTYIYLNEYPNGYLYVGSHTWNGEGIDPNYHGSSHVAKHFNWTPSKIEILEAVSPERKLVAEREWIEYYAEQYGIADCAAQFANSHKDGWHLRFRANGLMLNLHANSWYNATAAAARKVREKGLTRSQREHAIKQVKKLWSLPRTELQLEAARRNIAKAKAKSLERLKEGQTELQKEASRKAIKCAQVAHNNFTKEQYSSAARQRVANQKRKGYNFGTMEHCHNDEIRSKAMKTRLSRARKCILSDGFIGCNSEIAEHINCNPLSVGHFMSVAYKKGIYVSKKYNVTFKPYE